MEATSAIATSVETTATVAASAVEAAATMETTTPTAAVETSSAPSTVTAAMLGESRDGQTDEYEGSDAREK